ncbi:hypothetical protein PCANC_04033 [Puccinia coronata f. sp. avenae]|uniref:non-specific serine/threonine protein kinase n=1 Tax=Puccinia coronata f. sp. avenae TaxID=200324 RepID=A0A2N5W271_9BASI|nr:hypothetical protein PCANC_26358 [Puccinia coronata f. sp. avenae]PLW56317.1 hypothetical protein PCANC_04033 [Puccinia coronata f. sp. avenae]
MEMTATNLESILDACTLIKQGAEAKVYAVELVKATEGRAEETVLLKHRFPKTYRHPTLDGQLTRNRLTFEARSLTRALKAGSLREWLDVHQQRADSRDEMEAVLSEVGHQIAKLHRADIVHGDLTTSNMMLLSPASSAGAQPQVVMIDFGLSTVTSLVEDKAVDLYVLERAFLSTHSDPSNTALTHSSPLFEIVLAAYAACLSPLDWKALHTRLANVRMRGRKRSMVG